jgi:hypothetical protein
MSNEKKNVKRRPRVLAARDLMSVTGGAGSWTGQGPTLGFMPTGPSNPNPWKPTRPWGPTIGFAPTGPRNPGGEK